MTNSNTHDPHRDQPVLHAGAGLDDARAVVILLHGRGATAEGILGLAGALGVDDVAYLAPQAAGSQWYPRRFLEPVDANEPWLTSALTKVGLVVDHARDEGFARSDIVIGGFSQGACLAVEYLGRNARRWGGGFAFSGGLIGAELDPATYGENLGGTSIFFGCSDQDAHIPEARVHDSAELLEKRGANTDVRIYPGMAHTVNDDEIAAVREMLESLKS